MRLYRIRINVAGGAREYDVKASTLAHALSRVAKTSIRKNDFGVLAWKLLERDVDDSRPLVKPVDTITRGGPPAETATG